MGTCNDVLAWFRANDDLVAAGIAGAGVVIAFSALIGWARDWWRRG